MDFITFNILKKLNNTGHVVSLYPRKAMVYINDSKCYKVSSGTINKYKYYLKTNFSCN